MEDVAMRKLNLDPFFMEQLLRLLPKKPPSLTVRYTITTLLVCISLLIVIGVKALGAPVGPFIFFPAIFISSILFDRASGIYASFLSGVLLYVLTTLHDGWLPEGGLALLLGLYLLTATTLAFISEGLRKAWERAVSAERTKDLLLQEIGHRVKNNLAMAVSVLELQAGLKTNTDTRSALQKAILRIRAIASAHDYFHLTKHDAVIDMRHYLETLCQHLAESLKEVRPITVKVEADEISLRAEKAIPLGLITNELVTNSLKHAFPGDRGGTVKVMLKVASPLTLTVEDDGIGYSSKPREHAGSRLIHLLAKQVGATIDSENREPGCRVRLVMSETT
jgi:two-component system, sensor histidine kinase PdtaS